jgi:hypothetical protein
MPDDAYLYFTAATGDLVTNSKTLTNVLKEASITELGKGQKKLIEVMTDGLFTSSAQVYSLYLQTGSTSPGATKLMELFSGVSGARLSLATTPAQRLVAKVPLPDVGLDDYISLYWYALTANTTGSLLARILLNP